MSAWQGLAKKSLGKSIKIHIKRSRKTRKKTSILQVKAIKQKRTFSNDNVITIHTKQMYLDFNHRCSGCYKNSCIHCKGRGQAALSGASHLWQTSSGDKHTPAHEEAYCQVITALFSQQDFILLKKNNPLFCLIRWMIANNTGNSAKAVVSIINLYLVF